MTARAKAEEDKRPWLELAEKWKNLADAAENRQQAQQPQPKESSDNNSN
jgi:hypothetical protein